MKKANLRYLITIILFVCMLVVPVLRMDWAGGKVSEHEKRVLAAFPFSFDSTNGKISVGRSGVESWLNDNIGFRKSFMKVYTTLKLKGLGLSTSERVLIGRDGWYYYTGDDNIAVATGNYPLTENDLSKIAQYQQQISDYYHSLGKEYILMLTPSKTSIYPEYLPMNDETVAITPVDIVENYLKDHTDIIVYNPKKEILSHKKQAQLYHKSDTHWNEMGAYYVYRGLFDVMVDHDIIEGTPVEVSFSQGELQGEFAGMLGDVNLVLPEAVPIASWDYSFTELLEGEDYQQALAYQQQYSPAFPCNILKNNSVPPKTLQIYGDSQLMTMRKIPLLFAEHFSSVYNYAIRNVSAMVDSLANPDVVVFSCSERYINSLLTVPGDIPVLVEKVLNLPSRSQQSLAYHGIYLDFCNGEILPSQGTISTSLIGTSNFVSLSGWAADFSTMEPLAGLYLQVGNKILQCRYGEDRQSVADYFNSEALLKTGFSVTFPKEYLTEQSVSEICFIQVGTDGTYHYEPVSFAILE